MRYSFDILGTRKVSVAVTSDDGDLEPALRDLIRVIFCMSAVIEADTGPVAASSRSSESNVARIFDERPMGQNTTSKPPPEGIMNVEVWLSNAVAP